jgi:hypothetical protein
VRATFQLGHIDRAPVGDIETTLMVLMAGNAELNIRFRHSVGKKVFELDSRDIPAGDLPARLTRMRELIRSGEAELMKTSDV